MVRRGTLTSRSPGTPARRPTGAEAAAPWAPRRSASVGDAVSRLRTVFGLASSFASVGLLVSSAVVLAAVILAGGGSAGAQTASATDAAESAPVAIEGPPIGDDLRRMFAVDQSEGGPATIEADRIVYDPDAEVVRATGNVEVFYGGRSLRADEIVYDALNDRISATGEITVVNPDGSVLVADNAEFDSQIRDGFIRGARAVLADGQARIAAIEARRVDGAFTTLSKAVYSPCEVCAENPNPLWSIRARRVIQDEAARDIIYEDATFEVLGVPVGYLPFFRHADPSVKRRSGFLTPSFSSSSALGYSVGAPYYHAFSANRDVTLTPYLYTEAIPVLEAEYRAWDEIGRYTLGGSGTYSDKGSETGERWHFEGSGLFPLANDFEAGFEALIASDDTYLRRYDFSSTDRARSEVYVQRFRDDGYVSLEAIRYQSFRDGEFAGTIPLVAPKFEIAQNWDAPIVGGEIGLSGDFLQLQRTEGRDMRRVTGEVAWRRAFVSDVGLVFDTTASTRGDLYQVEDDPARDEGFEGRLLPLAAVTASFPLGRATESAMHVIEPIAQMVWSPYGGNPSDIPNEDSQDAELDELGVFSLNRFPGKDRWEEGPRATIGLRYERLAVSGPNVSASIGQTYRARETDAFSDRSGLDGTVSDFVGAWSVSDPDGVYEFGHRFRLSDRLNFHRNEAYGSVSLFDRLQVSGNYVFVDADPTAGADEDRSEASLAARLRLTDSWSTTGSLRRDIERERFVSAGSGLTYEDECVGVDFTWNRRFNSVDDAPSSTNFGVAIRLKTLGDR